MKIELICQNCHKKFLVPFCRKNAKFCSSKCYWEAMKNGLYPENIKRLQSKESRTRGRKSMRTKEHREKRRIIALNRPKSINKQIGRTLKKRYANSELKIWSTGLTKETNESIRRHSEKITGRHPNLSPELRKRKSEDMKGDKNPAKRPEVRKKISLANTGKKRSLETREKLKVSHLGNTNKKGTQCSESSKQLMRESHIKYMASGKLATKETSIERKIKEELEKQGIGFEDQKSLCGVTIVDFLLGNKTVIYCDGDYWHNLPKVKERDKKQNRILKENGFKVFRFWEYEINESPANCINQISFN